MPLITHTVTLRTELPGGEPLDGIWSTSVYAHPPLVRDTLDHNVIAGKDPEVTEDGLAVLTLEETGQPNLEPGDFRWQISFVSRDRNVRLGPYIFELTDDLTLDEIAESSGVPVNSSILTQALAAAAATAADRAAVEAIGTTNDGVIAGRINDPASATHEALSSRIAALTPLDQVDFVELVRAHAPRYTRARLVKTATNAYQVRLDDGVRGAVFAFIKDANDDFVKIDGGYTGYGDALTYNALLVSPGDITGTWNTTTSSWYTTQVGATFTKTIAGGDRLDFRTTLATNGGMWSITVDGGPAVLVSCQSANPAAVALKTIATGLDPAVPHTVVGTFLGNDPSYAPVGTARGWVRVIDSASPTIGGYIGSGVATTQVLAVTSNKELALDLRSLTDPAHRNWNPEHNAVAGAMVAQTATKFYVDGDLVNVAGMAVNDSVVMGDSFEIVQHHRGKLVTPGTEVLEYRTRHRLTVDGVLTFDGSAVCLAGVEVVTGFPMMLPGHAPSGTNEFVSGLLNRHTSPGDESTTFFATEADSVYSGAVVGATVPNVIGAGTLLNARLTFRRGKAGVPDPDERLYVWNRATYPKLYWAAFLNTILAPGDAYTWAFKMTVAEIPNARALVVT